MITWHPIEERPEDGKKCFLIENIDEEENILYGPYWHDVYHDAFINNVDNIVCDPESHQQYKYWTEAENINLPGE